MKQAVEMSSGAMAYLPGCVKNGWGIPELRRNAQRDRDQADLRRLL
jgi:hypothetical protein